MRRLTADQFDERPILLTSADPRMRVWSGVRDKRGLVTRIKAQCILGGRVTIPSSILIADDSAAKAAASLTMLLQHGVLLPDVRIGLPSFHAFVAASSVTSPRSLQDRLSTAALLDDNTHTAVAYDPVHVSKAFGSSLLFVLAAATLRGHIGADWTILAHAAERLRGTSIISSQDVATLRESLTFGREQFDEFEALLYHLVGAAGTGSAPLLPPGLASGTSRLLAHVNQVGGLIDGASAASVDSGALAAISELLELRSSATASELRPDMWAVPFDATFALAELSDALSIRSDIVDALDERAVVELAQSSEARLARQKLLALSQEAAASPVATKGTAATLTDFDGSAHVAEFRRRLREAVRDETALTDRVSSANRWIGWGGVVLGAATLPMTGGASIALSVGGMLLALGGSSADAWAVHRGRPLLTLVERFQKARLPSGSMSS